MGISFKELVTKTLQGGPGRGAFARDASCTLQISAVENDGGEARVTLTQHEYETGDSVTIAGGTGDWAGLNGTWTVTRPATEDGGNDKLTLDGSSFPTIVSGSAGSAEIGRITSLSGGDYVAVLLPIGIADENATLRFMWHLIERLWKVQQILAATWGAVDKSPPRLKKAAYSYDGGGARARNLETEYRVRFTCNEDDTNDTMISNVIDESGL